MEKRRKAVGSRKNKTKRGGVRLRRKEEGVALWGEFFFPFALKGKKVFF